MSFIPGMMPALVGFGDPTLLTPANAIFVVNGSCVVLTELQSAKPSLEVSGSCVVITSEVITGSAVTAGFLMLGADFLGGPDDSLLMWS